MSRDLKVIEIRDTIGLCPKTRFPGFLKSRVLRLEQQLLIQENSYVRAGESYFERVPAATRNCVLYPIGTGRQTFRRNRRSDAVFDFIKHDIVFKGIRPGDVVIVRILVSPNDSGSLVYRAINGFESYTELAVRALHTAYELDAA